MVTSIPDGAESSVLGGRMGATSTRSCTACHADNPASFVFCRRCGRLLPRAPPASDPTVEGRPMTSDQLRPLLLPISIELVRAGRQTLYDTDSIRGAIGTVESASRSLQELLVPAHPGTPDEYIWERNPDLAEASSLIEGAASLLALAAAPETRDNVRGLLVHRAFWVLQVAHRRTDELLALKNR